MAIRLTEEEFARATGKTYKSPPTKGVQSARERARLQRGTDRARAKQRLELLTTSGTLKKQATSQRGRQRTAQRKAAVQSRIQERAAASAIRIETNRTVLQNREQIRLANRQQNQEMRQASQRRSRVASAALAPATSLANASPASPVSASGGTGHAAITIVLVVGGLIIMYILVTKAGPTTGFLSSITNWIASLSTTNPLFTANTPTPTTTGTSTGTTGTSSGTTSGSGTTAGTSQSA